MTHSVNELFRASVVDSTRAYLGAPFRPIDAETIGSERDILELGTTPDPGFNCSDLVIRGICDALGKRPAEIWRPELRTTKNMAHALYGGPDYPVLDPEEIEIGDPIAWVDDGDEVAHMALALGPSHDSNFQYIHATWSGSLEPAAVIIDTFHTNSWIQAVHLPLEQLIEKSLR